MEYWIILNKHNRMMINIIISYVNIHTIFSSLYTYIPQPLFGADVVFVAVVVDTVLSHWKQGLFFTLSCQLQTLVDGSNHCPLGQEALENLLPWIQL